MPVNPIIHYSDAFHSKYQSIQKTVNIKSTTIMTSSSHRTSNTSKIGIILLSASIAGNCALAGALATQYWPPKASRSQTAEEALCLKIENCLKPATQEAERALQATTTRILTEMEASTTAQRSETDKQVAALLDTIDKTVCSSVHKATESQQARTEEQIAVLTAKINEISGIFSQVSATQTEESKKAMEELLAKATEVQTALTDSAATQQADILKLTETLIAGLKNEGMEQRAKAQEAAAALQSKLEALVQELAGVNTRIQSIQNEPSRLMLEYLEAARRQKGNPEVARLLYMSALGYCSKKTEILNEIAMWTNELVDQSLSHGNIEEAEQHLAQLAALFDSAITSGTVEDIEGIPSLKEEILRIDSKVVASKDPKLQQDTLNELAKRVESISCYEEGEELMAVIETTVWDSSLEDSSAVMGSAIRRILSCMTPVEKDIIIPEVDENTPWVAWLKHFNERLNAAPEQVPTNRKFEDLGTAAAFLEAAEKKGAELQLAGDSSIADEMASLRRSARKLQITRWEEQAHQAIGDKTPVLVNLSSILAEGLDFSSEEQELVAKTLFDLNDKVVELSLARNVEAVNTLSKLKGIKDDSVIQLLSIRQSHYLQLLVQIQEMQSLMRKLNWQEAEGEAARTQLVAREQDIKNKLASLEEDIDTLRDKLKLEAIQIIQNEHGRFECWSAKRIDEAQQKYKHAEKMAETWGKTWGNNEVQEELKNAWWHIMTIHPGDLSMVNPAEKQAYDMLKQDIEAKLVGDFKVTIKDLQSVKYTRIDTFRKK